MAKQKKVPKKTVLKQIEQQLIATFDHLKEEANPKRLKRSIRRASKILFSGLKPSRTKSKSKTKSTKTAEKTSKKVVAAE